MSNKHMWNKLIYSIFICFIVVLIIFVIGIVNNDFTFHPEDAPHYFDIASKISTPLIAIYIAIYYSTVTSNYQKISAIRALLSEIASDRQDVQQAMLSFSNEVENLTTEIRHKAVNRYPIYHCKDKLIEILYKLKSEVSKISSVLYMDEFIEFKEFLNGEAESLISIGISIDNNAETDAYYTLSARISEVINRIEGKSIELDLKISEEIETLKAKYKKYRIDMFT